MNPLTPSLMTTKERLVEVCRILAAGLVRLRMRDAQVSPHEVKFQLHFSPDQSGDANPPIRRTA